MIAYFLIPLDFIRVASALTLVDFVSFVFLFYYLALSGFRAFNLKIYFLFMLVASYVLLSGFFSPDYIDENAKLALLLLFIFVKVSLAYLCIDKFGVFSFLNKTAVGFLFLNALFLCYFILGGGLSGSGRFMAFFGNSNGLAAYSLFSSVLALHVLFNSSYSRLLALSLFLTSVLLGLLSLSKGFIVFFLAICFLWFMKVNVRNSFVLFFMVFGVFLLLSFSVEDVAGISFKVLDGLNKEFNLGADRIVGFLELLSQVGLSSELDDTRADLNKQIIEFYSQNPAFWGYGYDSSSHFTFGLRPHNILLTSLFELGIPFFVFIVVFFVVVFLKFFSTSLSSYDLLFVFWGVSVIMVSMKTPFYFSYAFPWFLLTYFILPSSKARLTS